MANIKSDVEDEENEYKFSQDQYWRTQDAKYEVRKPKATEKKEKKDKASIALFRLKSR